MKFLTFILLLTNYYFSLYSQSGNDKIFSIKKNLLKKHIEILGSDLFEGRGTGTKGGELAANYIADEFEKIGLLPIGDEGTYFQNVPMHGTSILNNSKLVFYSSDDTLTLQIGKDYILSKTGAQTFIPQAVSMVFVGYGIIAHEYDHNDYSGKSVEGKIVVMLNGEPESDDKDFFNEDEPTIFSYPEVKHRIAMSRGAAGTIIIPQIELNDSTEWNKYVKDYSFEDVTLPYDASGGFGIILRPKFASRFFVEDGKKINQNSILNCNVISTKECKLKFEGEYFQRDFKAKNIVGIITAKNNINEEYVIVSAHYDHLGIGPEVNNDKIYNGVLDNAIGVSTLLEVARVLESKKDYLNRSIIFIATTGEEKGLLGSTYYTDHPIVPLYKTTANINIDGSAYIDEFNSIISIGSELSDLDEYVKKTADNFDIKISKIPKEFYSYEAFNRSDQIAFAKAGIPSIILLDAPDYKNIGYEEAIKKIIYYDQNIYHTPFDDLSININYNAAKMHTEIIASLVLNITVSKKEIKWKKNVPYNYIRLQTIAEKR